MTLMKSYGDFQKGQYQERNFRFGVREHGMAAITNGLALHNSGLIPYCATFFIFTGAINLVVNPTRVCCCRLYASSSGAAALCAAGIQEQLRAARASAPSMLLRSPACWRVAWSRQPAWTVRVASGVEGACALQTT